MNTPYLLHRAEKQVKYLKLIQGMEKRIRDFGSELDEIRNSPSDLKTALQKEVHIKYLSYRLDMSKRALNRLKIRFTKL